MVARIPAEERLLNLTVALLGTEVGLTRAQIFRTVTGYAERTRDGVGEDTLGRMFERDKDTLTGLGTRIEVIGDASNPEDLRDARYRIPREANTLPEDLAFTPAEVALLALAAQAWGEASTSREARAGLRKIRALGLDVDEPILGFSPRVRATDAAFPALRDAIDRAVEVRFAYLRPGSARVRERRVRPLALVQFEDRWHLHGEDLSLGEPRTFLLSRIVSAVTIAGTPFPPELREGAAERTLAALRALADTQRAVVEVTAGSEAALRLGQRAAREAGGALRVPMTDAYVLADELASYGPEARVVDPPELRDLVLERLRATRATHEGPARPAPPLADARPARSRAATFTADRVRTVLTLVPWLLERGEVPVTAIAEEFELAPAEVRRLLSTLTLVGEPVGGMYTGEMFDLDWALFDERDVVSLTHTVAIERAPRFTAREVAALVAGLQLVAALPGAADAAALAELRAKLSRGAPGAVTDIVLVDPPTSHQRAELATAVREGRAVRFRYRRPGGESTERTVDPFGLVLSGGEWYLKGWCHLRRAERTFLVARMTDLEVTSEEASHRAPVTPELFAPGGEDLLATVRLPTSLVPLVADFLEHAETVADGSDTVARFPIADVGVVSRLAARGGGRIEVLDPAAAREAARTWAEAGENLHLAALH
ncbi:WYL domain-containing protein [Microbacterium excoecariae]|uniref:WYL domain-containing protein n=1 Tax=Microbacterium excoecariae TaxID=2715210 RepID=UPI00140BA2A7|nr:WYL domain-containing protein [Microbacterium excoecariae]